MPLSSILFLSECINEHLPKGDPLGLPPWLVRTSPRLLNFALILPFSSINPLASANFFPILITLSGTHHAYYTLKFAL